MRQELIDLLRRELSESEEQALRARVAREPELRVELDELMTLFGLMRRGEEIAPRAETRPLVLATAARAVRPSLLRRAAALPGLFAFRVRHSLAFRIAAASLVAHLLLMAVLYQLSLPGRAVEPRLPEVTIATGDEAPQYFVPDADLTRRLRAREYGHHLRVGVYGIEGQEERIRASLATWMQRQAADGSFGDLETTGQVTLALLAEGDCSIVATPRGRAISRAIEYMLKMTRAGDTQSPATLAALIEDYILAYSPRRQEALAEHLRAIHWLLPRIDDGVGHTSMAGEALALATLAGLPVPASREMGEAVALLGNANRSSLLHTPATRLAATALLAKGGSDLNATEVRAWLRPLFEAALAASDQDPVALLTLQAPYRL